jgi:hypothetical protein
VAYCEGLADQPREARDHVLVPKSSTAGKQSELGDGCKNEISRFNIAKLPALTKSSCFRHIIGL